MGSLVKETASARKPVVSTFAMLLLLTACACIICLAPVIATYSPLSIVRSFYCGRESMCGLDDGLRLLIGRGDDLCIGVERSLGRNHVHQLGGQVDIRAFQRA